LHAIQLEFLGLEPDRSSFSLFPVILRGIRPGIEAGHAYRHIALAVGQAWTDPRKVSAKPTTSPSG